MKNSLHAMLLLVALLIIKTSPGQNLEFGPPIFITQSGFNEPAGLGLDLAHNRILTAQVGSHRILHADLPNLLTSPAWQEFGFVADRSLATALNEPQGIAADASGNNVYVVDAFNNEAKLYVRDAGGNYTYNATFTSTTRNTVAGLAIQFPRDITVGADGKVYMLDSGNDRILVADGPADTSWQVWKLNAAWGNPYGIDIAADGTVYVADTDNHRIIKISGATETYYGSFGSTNAKLRFPRDVAVGDDGKMYIADTHNHRITILKQDGSHYRNLGNKGLFGVIQKIEVTAEKKIYTIDSDRNRIIAYLGPTETPPFDAYLRDYDGDSGVQPSNDGYILSSPDILVRHNADVDLALAEQLGLQAFAFQHPKFENNNYVYLAIRNRGTQDMVNTTVKLYWADPGSPMNFPANWKEDGIYRYYIDATHNELGNFLTIPTIPARTGGVDGVKVIGPFLWRPPAPESNVAADGNFYLLPRILHIDDPSEGEDGIDQVRLNNNLALRRAEVSRGPFPIGDQNTLVIGANFSDVSTVIDETSVMDKVNDAGTWIDEVSYHQTIIKPVFGGIIDLDDTRAFYEHVTNSMLVEMATEAIDKVLTTQPDILNGPTADPEDDIDRILIVINDQALDRDWATTGKWTYQLSGGGVKYFTVSVQGQSNSVNQFAHGLSHQLGLKDLYAYPNVEFPIAHPVDEWDNMAKPFEGAHPIVWSKELATWVTSHDGKIRYIARPPNGTPYSGSKTVNLSYQSILDSAQYGAIAFGLTEGITTFEEENHFYFVEARSPSLSNSDSSVPAQGVLMYYANKQIPQGQVPVIVRDHTPGTTTITDAALGVGDTESPAGTGIEVDVASQLPGQQGYVINFEYTPPATDYDVHIRKGDPAWISDDIWIDNQLTGGGYHSYDQATQKSSGPVDESPVGGEENRLYARVHNTGPATAYDIEVQFNLSAPYHTVDGVGSFDLYKSVFISSLPSGDYKDVFVVWEPEEENDPHNCVKVFLKRLTNDTNGSNNDAQQNLTVISSDQASPYPEVTFNFMATNEKDTPRLVYFKAEGIPPTWSKTLSPQKSFLVSGEMVTGTLKVKPPEGAPVCTDHEIRVVGWTADDHTLIPLGGTTVNVQLRNKTKIDMKARFTRCDDKIYNPRTHEQPVTHVPKNRPQQKQQVAAAGNNYTIYLQYLKKVFAEDKVNTSNNENKDRVRKGCAQIVVAGCTNPPRPNEKIIISYQDPSGNPFYKEVITDENGCFEDFHVVVEGGDWEVTANYPGDNCSGKATGVFTLDIPIPVTGDQDGDGRPDKDEVQGDEDGDGIPNQNDTDSDNDGRPDGDEPVGDVDNDGFDNMIDTDSDNDGIPDGRDNTPYGEGGRDKHKFYISPFVGLLVFDDILPIKDNFELGLRLTYPLSTSLFLEGELGICPTTDQSGNSGNVFQLNANFLKTFNVGTSPIITPYITGGIGAFMYKGFSADQSAFALNLGGGFMKSINQKFSLRFDNRFFAGAKVYDTRRVNYYYQASLGLVIKL